MATTTTFCDYTCVVTDIDRMKVGKRIVPMKLLVLGLGRTASESVGHALRQLGINQLYHGWQTLLDNPRDCQYWLQAIEAKFDGNGKPYGREEFDKLLGHCQGVSDLPAILFAKELIEAYPEAKVILTHRNFDTWYQSCYDTIETRVLHPLSKSLIPITFALRLHSRYTRPCWIRSWNILTGGNFSKTHARKIYDQHYATVRDIVAQQPKGQNNNKLLEYNVKEGWGPLCKFLEVPEPECEFPRGNQTQVFVKRLEKALFLTLSAIFQRLLLVAVVGVGGFYLLRAMTSQKTLHYRD